MLKKYRVYLLLVLIVALALRLAGVTHGFPFIFHPDEPAVIRSALGIRFDINPGHFDWPHLFIYLNYFLYMLFAKVRGLLEVSSIRSSIPGILWDDNLIFYLLSRVFAAVLGALTVIPVSMAAKRLFGERCAILSAAIFCILPFHVWHSHYALIDVPMAFFLAWSVYFSAGIFVNNTLKDYALAGLFVGLSASTKYNGALGVLVLVAASVFYFLHSKKDVPTLRKIVEGLGLSAVLCVFGFLVGTPFSLLDHSTFLRTDGPQGALWQFTNVGKVGVLDQFRQFFQLSVQDHPINLGVTFWIIFVVGFIYTLIRFNGDDDNRKALYLYLVSLFFIFYVSGLEKTRAHYFMIVYPVFALVVGHMIDLVLGKISDRKLKVILLFLIFLSPLSASIDRSLAFVRKDTRVQMYEWLERNTSTGDLLVYEGGDLEPVFASGMVKNVIKRTKDIKIQALLSGKGYLILSDNVDNSITLDGNETELSTTAIESIQNDGRRGPNIAIFKLPLPEE